MMMLVDRSSGKSIGITLFDSEDAMKRGDEALNAMSPGGGGSRTGVEFYEVAVQMTASELATAGARNSAPAVLSLAQVLLFVVLLLS